MGGVSTDQASPSTDVTGVVSLPVHWAKISDESSKTNRKFSNLKFNILIFAQLGYFGQTNFIKGLFMRGEYYVICPRSI